MKNYKSRWLPDARSRKERREFVTFLLYFFTMLRLLYKLDQVTMSSSAVSLDFICSLIVNLLNILVNVLLLWQSQKLFVIIVCFAGSRNFETVGILDPLTVLQKQRDTDPEATTVHLCIMKEKQQTKENLRETCVWRWGRGNRRKWRWNRQRLSNQQERKRWTPMILTMKCARWP